MQGWDREIEHKSQSKAFATLNREFKYLVSGAGQVYQVFQLLKMEVRAFCYFVYYGYILTFHFLRDFTTLSRLFTEDQVGISFKGTWLCLAHAVAHLHMGYIWSWVICSDVDGPRACHTEGSKSEREKQILYINTYIWDLEKSY